MYSIIFLIISIFTLIISCSDTGVRPKEIERFDLIYRFEKPRDSTILAVELEAITYYPDKDKSIYQLSNFQSKNFDKPMEIRSTNQVYFGCTRQVQLNVSKYWNSGDIFQSWRRYIFARDTITSIKDSLWLIRFPEDTVYAIHIF